jgi:hypothetical protein
MLKVNDVFALSRMLAAPNALVIVGAVATLRFADAVFQVPPFVEVTLPVVLVYWPAAAPVTVTLNWHWLFSETVAPVSAIPVGDVVVRVPPQTVDEELATVRPVGKVSANATPAKATAFAAGLVMVNVSEVVALRAIFAGLNTFAMVGGATTLIEAVAGAPVPPSFELTLLVVLLCVPAAIPVTFTEKLQDAFAARVPPARVIVFVPAVAVTVPAPQEPLKPFGVEMTSPEGNASVNPMPVRADVRFGLVIVKVSEVEPFSGMLAAPNALVVAGGALTVIEALAGLLGPVSAEMTVTLLFFTPAVVP